MHPKALATPLAIALIALAAQATAQQTIYRWVDKDGKVQFSDTPPPNEAKNVTQKRAGGGYVESSTLPYATQMAMKTSPATLYVSGDCGAYCSQARALLGKRGVPYTEKDAGTDKAAADAVQQLAGGFFVPLLTLGEAKLKGFDEDSWQSALDVAGYPRTALPGQVAPRPAAAAPKPAEAAPAAGEQPK